MNQMQFTKLIEKTGFYKGIAKENFMCKCCKERLILKDEVFAYGSSKEKGFCANCLETYYEVEPIIRGRNN